MTDGKKRYVENSFIQSFTLRNAKVYCISIQCTSESIMWILNNRIDFFYWIFKIDRRDSKYIYVCKWKCHKLTFWSVIGAFFLLIILLAMVYLISKKGMKIKLIIIDNKFIYTFWYTDSTSQVTSMGRTSSIHYANPIFFLSSEYFLK